MNMINTKKVKGRRTVRYESFAELLADAERHAQPDVRALGNWSPGQIYEHLARSLDVAIDGGSFQLPAPARWIMSLLLKRKFLYGTLPAGFKTSADMIPKEAATEAGLASLQKAITRQETESERAMHPGFGHITRAEWDAFNLRHAEMHMSFLVAP